MPTGIALVCTKPVARADTVARSSAIGPSETIPFSLVFPRSGNDDSPFSTSSTLAPGTTGASVPSPSVTSTRTKCPGDSTSSTCFSSPRLRRIAIDVGLTASPFRALRSNAPSDRPAIRTDPASSVVALRGGHRPVPAASTSACAAGDPSVPITLTTSAPSRSSFTRSAPFSTVTPLRTTSS